MKRGPKPKGQVKLVWTRQFAYVIGLLTADGCLSKDGRHIDFTSKDRAQVELFRKCLGLETKVSVKYSGTGNKAHKNQTLNEFDYKVSRSGEIGRHATFRS